MAADPWFSHWNYTLLQILFRRVPHSRITDECCDLLISNPLLSTWVFAASFYWFWMKDDELKSWRRQYLASAVVAFGIAALVTFILRPWINWPAPVLNSNFQPLFPRYLWGNGSRNCFPSHSTLAYYIIAAGFWPLNRRLSFWLSGMVLFFISLPRVYEGGHYPVDVVFSFALGTLALLALWRWPVSRSLWTWSDGQELRGAVREVIFFLWTFELGEGFRSVESLVRMARHAFRWWRR